MTRGMLPFVLLLLSALSNLTYAQCDSHTPAFPPPQLKSKDVEIRKAYSKIKSEIEEALKEAKSDDLSFSLAVTSPDETLFELHHTATDRDEKRPGVKKVDGSSAYRIASNTKSFTVLAIFQLQKAGKLNLDDPVNKYLPELDEHQTGSLPWKDITLRTLATQLSGIPRNLGLADFLDNPDRKQLGLPDITNEHREICDSIWKRGRPCTTDDLYGFLREAEPVLAPKQFSTYSNNNFIILGQVIEKVTGQKYTDYIKDNILDELELSDTTFTPPDDSVAVLPKGRASSFSMDFGIQNPTGGLISTSNDMMKWARYILTHYNGLTPVVNWLQPQSFATGMNSFYGMPWEIFRTDKLLPYTRRPVTFVTKGGGWPGYTSVVGVVPEYGFGFTALVGFSGEFGNFQNKIAGILGQHMVEAADTIAQKELQKYTGTFAASADQNINSSITISHSPTRGLYISSWISDSIDAAKGYKSIMGGITGGSESMYIQLVPTLLFKNERKKTGEIWRILVAKSEDTDKEPNVGPLNKDFCITNLDIFAYGGKPMEEVVFNTPAKGTHAYTGIDLTGWRISLHRTSEGMLQNLLKTATRGQKVFQKVQNLLSSENDL